MKFYTSYFGNIGSLPKDAVLVSISLWSPRDWKGKHIKQLAPTEDILREYKRKPDAERYTRRYVEEVLAGHSAERLVEALKAKWGDGTYIFLCYERPGKFCHRRLVAAWLEAVGIPCPEYPTQC